MFEQLFSLFTLLPFEWAQFQFMFLAILAILLIAPLLAIVGTLATDNQMTFFSDAVGHAAITGLAIATLAELETSLWGIVLYAQLIALVLFLLKRFSNIKTDALIGIIANFSVALGIVLLSYTSGLNRLNTILFGSILSIGSEDLTFLCISALVLYPLIIFLYKVFWLVSVSPTLAKSRGLNFALFEYVLLAIIALVISVSILWIGVLVLNAMLILPASIAKNIGVGIKKYLTYSIIIGIISSVGGLLFSYYFGTSTGATIVLLQTIIFMLTLLKNIKIKQ
ncbi:MAG: hypothetical protein A2504_05305 [Bdellovibrionales bacterium RIFOXYD12_FULL_39_22]|nr:MAG: hypothetical protein A2385_06520 [Bdellovibrionales bacterium RIFOXYB1_FULL_39_21]OFZ41932.1 MAG: hypothetical protein A2485_08490 [Bdellovibrionales bacterium RIFOXYC12_FULL_39_17]OFZ50648.1 MAG: hypothetical protein A2404_05440 [Bdellovibrionales bacterium RIFOXYC1_FULL_39_130]OFZ71892.1 MAG: hypothetical protein A2451_01795 [Bdellovibrionales bacterium RIFOXYC2_FULL_39_8]OFZ77871.1 MAG: hypothetical protein A2560_00610 [Bdellovibrionales bacterium RIFOXYD1_FULL_39_84]OFZ93693.1 MAG: